MVESDVVPFLKFNRIEIYFFDNKTPKMLTIEESLEISLVTFEFSLSFINLEF
jgi:hypothetical protein